MYDCSGPTLVFVTQTHHPLLNTHTGYIFAEYDVTYSEPRELFFQHIADAQVYALKRGDAMNRVVSYSGRGLKWTKEDLLPGPGMVLIMNPDAKPERISALSYLLNCEDDSRYTDMVTSSTRKVSAPPEVSSRTSAVRADDVGEVSSQRIDFFGEDL